MYIRFGGRPGQSVRNCPRKKKDIDDDDAIESIIIIDAN
jgi:hypothetical protein